MCASFDEVIKLARAFPSYREENREPDLQLYEIYREAERTQCAEPIDVLKYDFVGKDAKDRLEYLTRRQYEKLCRLVNDADSVMLVEDKATFAKTYRDYLGRCVLSGDDFDERAFYDLCREACLLVAKPVRGAYGKGVQFIHPPFPATELRRECKEGRILIESAIEQNEALARLHPSSVNCVRVVTAIGASGLPKVVGAVLRCGRDGSVTDSGNGLFAGIRLLDGSVVTPFRSHFGECFEAHPDTGTAARAIIVPRWGDFLRRARAAAGVLSGLRLMNWDWALDRHGRWCLIEGNTAGGLGPCQEAFGRGFAREIMAALEVEETRIGFDHEK